MANTKMTRATVAVAVLAMIGACTPIVERHGYVPRASTLAQLTPGVSTRAQALELLPKPQVQGPLDSSDLYYVYSEFRGMGPLTPREVDRQVVAINIGRGDVITGITRYGLADGRVVPLQQRITDNNVSNINFVKQLLGKLGRFNPGALLGR